MSYSLEQAKIDIARLQTQINAYERIAKAFPGLLDVRGYLSISNTPTIDSHATTKKYVDDADNLKADDADVVHNAGNESIAGIKTFSSFPVLPSSNPTTDYQAATKKYVDDNTGGGAEILEMQVFT